MAIDDTIVDCKGFTRAKDNDLITSLSTVSLARQPILVRNLPDCTIYGEIVQPGGIGTGSKTGLLQWNLSKMVPVLGSHLSKTASLPGPK